MSGKYEKCAHDFVEFIKTLASKPENLDNFECYLSHNFDEWLMVFGKNPEDITWDIKQFANMVF